MDESGLTMKLAQNGQILVLNSGSSSVKYAVYTRGTDLKLTLSGAVERIGLAQGRFYAHDANGVTLFDECKVVPDHAVAVALLLDNIKKLKLWENLVAVGHRVVHGGPHCDCPMWVDSVLEQRLQALIPLAPLHLPHNLTGIREISAQLPGQPQIACFDTAFHHDLPRVARMTGLSRELQGPDLRRYGFHGLSYEYVLEALRQHETETAAQGRLIVAHLGNGASMTAIRAGKSIETTMGFSSLSGLLMGTRCGDLDPGLILYLLKEKGMTVDAVEHQLYKASGLLGISGTSRSMQDLLTHKREMQAAEAIELFCYRARKHLAALSATMAGLDRLVFTGGIGANSPEIREAICAGLSYLGIEIDQARNRRQEHTISTDRSAITVQAFPADEELMIARHTHRALTRLSTSTVADTHRKEEAIK